MAGIVELPQADSLFQRVVAPPQSQPAAPPDNVVLLPAARFASEYTRMAHTRPDLVTTQIHAVRDHAGLPSDPSSAFIEETGAANNLASRPDGVLVSAETVNDFQLNQGDLIRLRLQDAKTHTYRTVPFHYVGIVNEFPTAPKDSFLVANSGYVAQQTHSNAVGTFLVNTGGSDVNGVASRIRGAIGTSGSVATFNQARGLVGSSLTSVDLSKLTRLELGFALLIAAAAGGLVIGLGIAERRQTVAVATALGATRRQVRRFGSAEPVYVLLVGTVCGLTAGWGLSYLLVKVLTGVFDLPPTVLSFPWGYLTALVLVTAAAVGVVSAAVVERARRQARDLLRTI
ncbi:FtsX-like permease family protein [Nocardioides panaciterrulae]|uniref:ABC-type antimicrobial peptide transport system permease subunit n=1 Tax=Nocardioides panaciterrulae TaxID=661492 RepID=A0A7Y9E7M4_9ACTN|nr:ABC-type antimicrobial peptide transport system permease subunit [Nocardioides panaciterrulae]